MAPRNKANKKSFHKFKKKNQASKHDGESEKEDSDFEEAAAFQSKDAGGFPTAIRGDDLDDDMGNTQKMIIQHNKTKKSAGKKSGDFQSMGLSHSVITGIKRKGYKLPTPIQRKTIPMIMDGKDVVAMARTGSGKTAAFLIPMFERLKQHETTGARALIMSPTRELALQTLKFTKDIGKFTGLKAAVILGGDSMEEQFAALHEHPDIIIATPGRFMHVCVEMELKLTSVEYVVFDEADRLFEMGFQEQLNDTLNRLPEGRQTLLFSATLPKLLVEFARAGLHDPTLLRLDVDSKLSENLKTAYFQCRSEDKAAVLLHLLRNVVTPQQQTVVFVATKHHCEYLSALLRTAGLRCATVYSALDQTARKINTARFANRSAAVLVVTDLAARGIDIPALDNVINYNFPAKPKLFVHRVGRVARAGQSGTAYSIVSPDEVPLMLDLHLGLGRPVKYVVPDKNYPPEADGLCGRVPQSAIDAMDEDLQHWHKLHEIETLKKVSDKGYSQYLRSREPPSKESVKRMKEREVLEVGYHPVFGIQDSRSEMDRCRLLESVQAWRPRATIFEINSTSKTEAFNIMKKKRAYHENVIAKAQARNEDTLTKFKETEMEEGSKEEKPEASMDDIQETFGKVVAPKFDERHDDKKKAKKKKQFVRDEKYYVDYRPQDYHTEQAMSLGTSFATEAAGASLDIIGDDAEQMKQMRKTLKWDRKRKKYVAETGKEMKAKKIKTESGQWIPATYKTNIYKDWVDKSKYMQQKEREEANHGSDEEEEKPQPKPQRKPKHKLEVFGGGRSRGFHRQGMPGFPTKQQSTMDHKPRSEIKTKDLILKKRRLLKKKQAHQKFATGSKGKGKGGGKKR